MKKKKNILDRSKTILLVGNPNVGKSTVFNALTGLRQHTGNWPGKTVSNTMGYYKYNNCDYKIYDLPGIYSLFSHSEEEEIARNLICFDEYDLVVVVCDGLSLMRNLNLVLQISEIANNMIVCVNLMDEVKKKNIDIDLEKLEQLLGVRVVATSARNKKGLKELQKVIEEEASKNNQNMIHIRYNDTIERKISIINKKLKNIHGNKKIRWISLNIIRDNTDIAKKLKEKYKLNLKIKKLNIEDNIVEVINNKAEEITNKCVRYNNKNYNRLERKVDKILTNKITGIPIMLILLSIIFYITIVGSNYPSSILSKLLFSLEKSLLDILTLLRLPSCLISLLVYGIYRVLAWVISVMLPPMAIFFPLFTILEDLGYLPRIAFNLDSIFEKCKSCGKQALTMCMGFGCNAVGVMNARIIDSKRERLIAIITNSFIPCNGRFPMLISIITMFLVGFNSPITSVLILLMVILLGIFMTFIVSRVLSNTILKGVPSSFTLELPPYRTPEVGKVIIRSIFDRTIFVLGRAIVVAIPAGLIIWLMANIKINDITLLHHTSCFLDPFASLIGMDGVILLAFILGFPANEIVIPIIIMGYMSNSTLTDMSSLVELKKLFISNGWTFVTAINVMIFTLFHFPCSTTCLSIKKETNSWKWTILSIIIPLFCGITICFLFTSIMRLFFN